MMLSNLKFNALEVKIDVFYEPIIEPFNVAPFYGDVSSMNDIDTYEIIKDYQERFEDAWRELAEK